MKRVLITGCNGFVAQDIINELSKEYEVYGIGRDREPVNKNVRYIRCDISDRDALFENVTNHADDFDAIVHVAAYLGNEAEKAYRTNCYGTQNIVDLAKMTKCRTFVLISGLPIIGEIKSIPIDEKHLNCPKSIYHRTKYLSEIICQTSFDKSLRCVILRIASPVGEKMPNNKVFSTFVHNAMKGFDLSIYGSGERIQNYIDTRDVGNAVRLSLESKKARGLYVLSGNSVSDTELAKQVIACFYSNSTITIQNMNIEDEEKWIVSDKKAREDFNYQPLFSLEDSFAYVAKGIRK